MLCCNSLEIYRFPVNSLDWFLGSGLGQVVLHLFPSPMPSTWHLNLLALWEMGTKTWLGVRRGENMLSPIFCMCHIPQSASGPTPAGSETYLETLKAYGCKGRIKSLNLFFSFIFIKKQNKKNHWISMTQMGTICCLSEKSTKVLKVPCKHSYYFYWCVVDLQWCTSFCCTPKWFSYTCMFFFTFFPMWFSCGLLQGIGYGSLCYIVGVYCLKIWINASRICVSFLFGTTLSFSVLMQF